MVLKLLVLMVAVAVLEGVAGLQEKPFANGTQIKANPDHKKRGRRLDKLPCLMMDGICQPKGEHCNGAVREGSEWCLHHRHFECCYPYGCWLGTGVCPNGATEVQSCIRLVCNNGCWEFDGWDPRCGLCYTHGMTTIVPYVWSQYIFSGIPGPYVFSAGQHEDFGIEIVFASPTCITEVVYYEPGVFIYILPLPGDARGFLVIDGNTGVCINFPADSTCTVHPIYGLWGVIYIYFNWPFGIYIIGSRGLSVYVAYGFPCLMNVVAIASPSLIGELNKGLCAPLDDTHHLYTDNPLDIRYTFDVDESNGGYTFDADESNGGYTFDADESNGGYTFDVDDFIQSWKVRSHRKRNNIDIQKIIKDHTLQFTDQTIVEKSMSDIVKSCEEMNEGPCSVLSSEDCEILQETCVSRMSNVDVPGQGDSSDSSE